MRSEHERLAPIDILRHEHVLVERVIAAMEREARTAREHGRVNGAAVRQMIDFAQGFTDGCHRLKEERLVFARLRQRDASTEAPTRALEREHESGRSFVRSLVEHLPVAQAEDARARRTVIDALTAYAELLRGHIAKEDAVLFPIAERLLEESNAEFLAHEFERVEREETGVGVHEKYEALAHEISGEAFEEPGGCARGGDSRCPSDLAR